VTLNIQGAAEKVQQLLLEVCKRPVEQPPAAAALAAAAVVLDAAAVSEVLTQRLTRDMASHPACCIALIKGLAAQQQLQQQLAAAAVAAAAAADVENLVSLALAVPELPAVQQSAVAKAAAALQQGPAADPTGGAAVQLQQPQGLTQPQQQQLVAGVYIRRRRSRW
jgi:hypothetical protein